MRLAAGFRPDPLGSLQRSPDKEYGGEWSKGRKGLEGTGKERVERKRRWKFELPFANPAYTLINRTVCR